ncbi:hypothetical protein ACHAXA_001647 [Cyclostephanos tholiformis]|uniref:Uncharacterized protein n=1 Tax=Cyclostephanos tholiformis TaxID=382380 RepID=A0ABD3RVC3_9STRA
MGSVFGKESVKEPPFEVLLERNTGKTGYELRKYGTRFGASVEYSADDTSSPFGILAKYIGVFGTPQNSGSTSIAMTAPVVMENEGPTSIAMTAPVVMGSDGEMKKMMFMLPAEYDDMSKIPKPTNPIVHIEEIPPEIGAVYRYNGLYNNKINREKARMMGMQLMADDVPGITEDFVLNNFQFWGYNPPFTIPYFRRNEIWVKLNDEQANYLIEKFPGGRLRGGSSSSNMMSGRAMYTLGLCGLVVGAYAVGFIFKSKSQYRRL